MQWPALQPLQRSRCGDPLAIAALCDGWDGRQVSKLVLPALAQRLEVAKDPARSSFDDLREAARKNGGVEWAGGGGAAGERVFPRRARQN